MDTLERQELLNSVEEIKELVDEAFPLESSVVRDQVLSMLIATTIQAKLMGKYGPQTIAQGQFDFNQLIAQGKELITEYKELEQRKMALTLTQVASEMTKQLSPETGKEWAWETFQHFLKMAKGG